MINKKILTVTVALAAAAVLLWAAPALIHAQIERQLRNVFKDARVSVGRVSIERPLAVAVSDIAVEANGYQITVKKAAVDPALRLVLADPFVRIKSIPDGWNLPSDAGSSGASGKPMIFSAVSARGLVVELQLSNLKGTIRGSVECDLRNYQVRSAHLESPSLRSGSLKIETIIFDLPEHGTGVLSAERLSIDKVKVTGLKGAVVWEETTVIVDPIAASWVRGAVGGHARLETQNPFGYEAELRITQLDLDAFTEEMKLKNKMSADGKLAGKITVKGDVSGVHMLIGHFTADEAGGDLVIQDPNFLKYLAQNTRQPITLVEAAFKEYHFDTGAVSVGMSGRDLKLDVDLNGAKGKRNFEINLHDQL